MEKTMFRGHFLRVTTEKVAEQTLERVYVRNGVSVIPVLPDGRIRCIEEEYAVQRRVRTKLVSGWLNDGEDPAACARRELQEEAGLCAGRIQHYLTAYAEGAVVKAQYYFIARELTGVGAHPEPNEIIIRTVDVSLDELQKAVLAETFGSGSTAFALLKFCTEYGEDPASQGPQ